MYPKVLVISHNVFSQTSNMGRTLANFFDGWDVECLAQLYLRNEVPTLDICKNYFRITDFDVLKKKSKDIGDYLGKDDIKQDFYSESQHTVAENKIYNIGTKRKPYMYILRNLLWIRKNWKNKKLIDWVNDFNPDVIFFASGDYIFSYRVAMEISKIKNIPIVSYVCDDYYFINRKSFSPLYYLNKYLYKKELRHFFSNNRNIVSICDKIREDYTSEFGVNATTIMTSSSIMPFKNKINSESIKISYIGNLGYNRYISVIEIGKALKKLTNGEIKIDVYSAETNDKILRQLNEENGIDYHGRVLYSEVVEIMEKSDILIHTEAMDVPSRDKVRYSVSTKIADSLLAGRCIFAYGPEDVASIEYLIQNDCACVVTDSKQLDVFLKKVIYNKDIRESYAQRGIEVAKLNHNQEENRKKIYNCICESLI